MRKHQQQEIFNILNEIGTRLYESKQAADSYDYNSAEAILTDCQDIVIQLGTFIERTEGKEHSIIVTFEEYCEEIYRTSQVLMDETALAQCFQQLQRLNNKITDEVKEAILIKYEVIFLPYSAAMWDSLESIWKAAKEDINCECYVVPIPYYELDKASNTFTVKYEGALMPDYVPITSYKDFDISLRRPDVIFIHNPYDQFNYVTSVHPNYYSSELKKYTDMLVYVPYFVTGGDLADSFYELPSYYHVDKIVIQSERIRKFYSNKIPEDKFLALGSPKFDRVIFYEKNKPQIPQEWKEIIGNKKVIFYNTSISNVLQFNEKALDKINYVFSCFKERDDVVLLWRPHPLIKATLKSLRPGLLEKYIELEETFIREKFGIYDTTPNITASVAISDAYIGETSSSVIHLFGVTGKPVFILDMHIVDKLLEEWLVSRCFCDCYVENNEMWFVTTYYNILCKMNLTSGMIEEVTQLSDITWGSIQYLDVFKIENHIYILPYQAEDFCIYDLDKKTLQKIPIPDTVAYNFDRMIHYKNYIFLKPKCYSAIVRYDMRDGSCTYFKECMKEFLQQDHSPMFLWGVSVRENLLLMASFKENKVLEFNMETGDSKVHVVGNPGNNYFSMTYDEKDYWLVQNEGKSIVRWNYETGKTTEYNNFPCNFAGESKAFINIVYCNGDLLAFPRCANMILKIDTNSGQMREFNMHLPYQEGERKFPHFQYSSNYYFAKKYDDTHIVAASAYDNCLIIINTETETYDIIKCRLKSQVKFNSLNEYYPYVSTEDQLISIEGFLDYLISDDEHSPEGQRKAYEKVAINLDGTCGIKVHAYIMNELRKG